MRRKLRDEGQDIYLPVYLFTLKIRQFDDL